MPRRKSTHVDDPAAVGERLRTARERAGLTQRDLAFPGCSPAYISRIESGDRIPSLQLLRELGRRLGVSEDFLATGENRAAPDDPRLLDAELALRLGDEDDAQRLYEEVLASPWGNEDYGRALAGLGELAFQRGEPARGDLGDRARAAGLVRAARGPAVARRDARPREGDDRPVRRVDRRSSASCLEAAEERKDTIGQLRFAVLLANALIDRGDFATAADVLSSKVETSEGARDPLLRARLYWSQSRLYGMQNDHAQAARYARRALEIVELAEDDYYTARAHEMMAHVEIDREHPEEALRLLDRAWPLLERTANPVDKAGFRLERARALAALGRSEEAGAIAMEVSALLADAKPLPGGPQLRAARRRLRRHGSARAGAGALRARHREAPVAPRPLPGRGLLEARVAARGRGRRRRRARGAQAGDGRPRLRRRRLTPPAPAACSSTGSRVPSAGHTTEDGDDRASRARRRGGPGRVVLALALLLAIAAPLARGGRRAGGVRRRAPAERRRSRAAEAGQGVEILAREYGQNGFGRIASVTDEGGRPLELRRASADLHDLRRDHDRVAHLADRHPRLAAARPRPAARDPVRVGADAEHAARPLRCSSRCAGPGGTWHGVRKIVLGRGATRQHPVPGAGRAQRHPALHAHQPGGQRVRRRLQRHPRVPQHRVASAGVTLPPVLGDLPLAIDGYGLERLEQRVSSEFTRVTTVVHLRGGGEEGIGEDVTYDADDQQAFQDAGPSHDLTGVRTLGDFCELAAGLDLFPAPPKFPAYRLYRRWAFESAALDLALRQAGVSLAERLGLEARPVRFVVSMRLGEPATIEPVRKRLEQYPWLEFKLDATSSWTDELVAELGRDRRRRVDRPQGALLRHHGRPAARRRALPAHRRRLPERVDRGSRARRPRPRPCSTAHWDRVTWDEPIHSIADLEALPHKPRGVNLKPSRIGSIAAMLETYEYCTANGIQPVRRRPVRARPGPRPDPVPRLAVPRGGTERRRAPAVQRGRAPPRPAGEPAHAGARPRPAFAGA